MEKVRDSVEGRSPGNVSNKKDNSSKKRVSKLTERVEELPKRVLRWKSNSGVVDRTKFLRWEVKKGVVSVRRNGRRRKRYRE